MPLSRQDKDYRFSAITPIDAKLVDLDRVFTNLLPLLKYEWSGRPRRRQSIAAISHTSPSRS
jgi:hypothetical protein